MRVLQALAIVLASIALLRALLVARGWLPGGATRSRMRIVEALALGGRQRLLVVEVEGERLLLGASESAITVLRALERSPAPGADAGSEPASAAPPSPPFRLPQILRRALPLLVLA